MQIKYVLGGAGYGKSHYLYSKLLSEAKKDITKKYYVLVPEQGNLKAQRELVKMSENGCIMNVDVLSFLRLAHRTFDEEGIKEKRILENTGKSMVVRKLLGELSPNFKFFKKASEKVGFTEEMRSLITEFMQYGLSVKDLERLSIEEGLSPVLKAKMHDACMVYEAFLEYKKEKYIVAEKMLDLLSETLDKSSRYQDAVFVFDGFFGFTPTQLAVIQSLLPKAKALYFAFTIDEETFYEKKTEDYQLFYQSKKTILKLNEIAKKAGALVHPPEFVKPYLDRGDISKIEKRLFRFHKKDDVSEEKNQILIKECKNPKEEAGELLMNILSLVRDEGYRYRDIAIVTGDMEEYGDLVYHTLKRAGLPVFLDQKKNISTNPFIEFLKAGFLVVEENFSYEAVMRYLRSGFSGILKNRADVFENFILKRGIKGKRKYQSPYFDIALFAVDKEEEKDELHSIEYIRKKIWEAFQPLYEVLKSKKKNAREKTLALYEFIKKHRAEEKLFVMAREFQERGEFLLSKEYGKCYGIVMDILEKMAELLGDEYFKAEDFSKILEEGFLEGKTGLIPSSLDEIIIGDMKRTRFPTVKAFFILGMNDGKIPTSLSKKGLITDRERESLTKVVELAPSNREKTFMELFYLYRLFSLPTAKLFLSYALSASDGKKLRRSYLVTKLSSLFDEKKEETASGSTKEASTSTSESKKEERADILMDYRRDGGRKRILALLRKGELQDEGALGLIRYYLKAEEGLLARMLKGYEEEPVGQGLDRELALRLYGELKGSITRLEKYVSCPYAHFLTYGLRLKEREEFVLQSYKLGNLYHEILERFIKKAGDLNGSLSLSEADRIRLLDESLAETIEEGYDILYSTARNRQLINVVRRVSLRSAWALGEQIKAGSFLPAYLEEGFVTEKLKGRIDRIDTVISDYLPDGSLLSEVEDGENFLKVEYARLIDYKSGSKSFDLNEAYYGLDLQLLLYLRNLTEILRNKPSHEKNLIVPMGAYYYKIDDPIRNRGEGEEAFLKALTLDGITLNEPLPILLTDKGLGNKTKEGVELSKSAKTDVIKLSVKADGNLSSTSAVYSGEEIKSLVNHSEKMIKEKREEILSGRISPKPYKLSEKTGCDFCEYESICRFKARLPGYSYRRLKKLSEEDIFLKLGGENGNEVDKGTE